MSTGARACGGAKPHLITTLRGPQPSTGADLHMRSECSTGRGLRAIRGDAMTAATVTPGQQETISRRNREAMIRGFARWIDPDELLREAMARRVACPDEDPKQLLLWNDLYVEKLPPLSALLVGGASPFGQWEIVDFLAASYPTVGESFSRIGRHFSLIKPHVEFVVDPGEHGALPYLEFHHGRCEYDQFFDEYTAGVFLAHFRMLTRSELRLATAHVVRARPEDAIWRAEVEGYLGCVPVYGARYTRLTFSHEDWARPLVGANPRLRATLEAHAIELQREASLAQGFGARVRAVIGQSLREGEPRVGDVAQRLGMTARTLQRRLQDEALGFTALVDEARLELARRYLADETLTISEVSFALGYSEPSAFTRAFKRWSGSAPAEYRESSRRAVSQ